MLIEEIIFFILRLPIWVTIVTAFNEYLYTPITNIEASNFMQKYLEIDPITVDMCIVNVLLRKLIAFKRSLFSVLPDTTTCFIYDAFVLNVNNVIMQLGSIFTQLLAIVYTDFNQKWVMGNSKDEKERLAYIKSVLGDAYIEPPLYPSQKTLISFEGIDWLCNNALDIFDLLKRNPDGTFSVDTTILNKYEYQLDCQIVGSIGIFQLTAQGFTLQSVRYNGVTYIRSNVVTQETYLALYAFYAGVMNYTQICSHLAQTHFLVSPQITNWNRTLLPCNHPLRRVLLPTELNTIPLALKAITLLINEYKNGVFYFIYNHTDKGSEDLIADYVKNFEYDYIKYSSKEFMSWLKLTPLEMTYTPFKTYLKWHTILRKFADNFVDELYSQNLVTSDIITWLSTVYPQYKTLGDKESIKRILCYMYFGQLRHQMLSNTSVDFIENIYLPTLRKDVSNNYYTLFSQQFNSLVLSTAKLTELPKLTMDLSFLIDQNPQLKAIYAMLYADINNLDMHFENNDVMMIKPSLVNISSGV